MKLAIFNTEMVRATLDGRKTQTRIEFKFKKCIHDYVKATSVDWCLQHREAGDKWYKDHVWSIRENHGSWADYTHERFLEKYAPYKIGDIIYVRETWALNNFGQILFKADMDVSRFDYSNVKWKPSIHMTKEYARLFLRVKDVRIERLNEISEEDAEKEGIEHIEFFEFAEYKNLYGIGVDEVDGKYISFSAKESFGQLWESIYGHGSFDNRYIWVIEFEQISKEDI